MKTKKQLLSLLTLLLLIISACGTSSGEQLSDVAVTLSGQEVYALLAPATVEITGTADTFTSTGTGMFIDDKGTVLTNYHVVESCYSISIQTYDKNTYTINEVLGFDKDLDLAILSTDCTTSSSVQISDEKVKVGDKVYVLGSSLGLTSTFSEGIVSSESRIIDGHEYIQTTAPISNGNSGGPLVNEYGQVVGIISAGFDEGQNLNLAIPISKMNKVSRSRTYTVYEFFQLSQGKRIDDESSSDTTSPSDVGEDYTPIDMGTFESLVELNDAVQRNPNDYILPVIVSVKGYVVRCQNDELYIACSETGGFDIRVGIHSGNADMIPEENKVRVYMQDDSHNRVLSGDYIIITGIYRNDIRTLSDCVYQMIRSRSD